MKWGGGGKGQKVEYMTGDF